MIQQFTQAGDPMASTSEGRVNPFSVTSVVKPEHLQFLPKFASIPVKKEPQEPEKKNSG